VEKADLGDEVELRNGTLRRDVNGRLVLRGVVRAGEDVERTGEGVALDVFGDVLREEEEKG
jgi:hypothetical protein